MSVHNGHRHRIRESYINNGLEILEDHQVLELLLYYCYPRRDMNELAHSILEEFGTLHNLFEADALDICRRCGVSETTGVLFSLVAPLTKRYSQSKWSKRATLDTPARAGKYALSLFHGKTVEHFYVICLDKQKNLINAELMGKGTIDAAPVYPREVVETALKNKAACIVLSHNHPGGHLEPSVEDIAATKKITSALKVVNIAVIDHIIVAGNEYFSFSQKRIRP